MTAVVVAVVVVVVVAAVVAVAVAEVVKILVVAGVAVVVAVVAVVNLMYRTAGRHTEHASNEDVAEESTALPATQGGSRITAQ